jgi:predicted  nucleic acid-binding Zn-ribbon protein
MTTKAVQVSECAGCPHVVKQYTPKGNYEFACGHLSTKADWDKKAHEVGGLGLGFSHPRFTAGRGKAIPGGLECERPSEYPAIPCWCPLVDEAVAAKTLKQMENGEQVPFISEELLPSLDPIQRDIDSGVLASTQRQLNKANAENNLLTSRVQELDDELRDMSEAHHEQDVFIKALEAKLAKSVSTNALSASCKRIRELELEIERLSNNCVSYANYEQDTRTKIARLEENLEEALQDSRDLVEMAKDLEKEIESGRKYARACEATIEKAEANLRFITNGIQDLIEQGVLEADESPLRK